MVIIVLCRIVQDGGQYLVAVDESNEHVMSVWDWQKTDRGQRITEVKVVIWLFCDDNLHIVIMIMIFCIVTLIE